jgi:hypothetical protein
MHSHCSGVALRCHTRPTEGNGDDQLSGVLCWTIKRSFIPGEQSTLHYICRILVRQKSLDRLQPLSIF